MAVIQGVNPITNQRFQIPMLRGPAGAGVPNGGTTGQVLAKASSADTDTEWVDAVDPGLDEVLALAYAVVL